MAKAKSVGVLWFGAAALLFTAIAIAMTTTRMHWLGEPLLLPGFLASSLVFPDGAHSDHFHLFFVLIPIFEFLIVWGILLLLLKLAKSIKGRENSIEEIDSE